MAKLSWAILRVLVAAAAMQPAALAGSTRDHHLRHQQHTDDNLPTVNTTSGTFQPLYPPSYPNLASFLDIPYAENPTGPLRFAPPVLARAHNSSSPVKATSLPGGCFQYYPPSFEGTVSDSDGGGASWLLHGGDYSGTTEDCLRLAVFAPREAVEGQGVGAAGGGGNSSSPGNREETCGDGRHDDEEEEGDDPLPVIIFVHGGGYSFGGLDVAYWDPSTWVSRGDGSHIVVSVQYRLNLLGLPNAAAMFTPSPPPSTNQSTNLPLLDLRLAIQWIHTNIASFGGDPSRLVLWGQSAGAYAVDAYRFAWAEDPLVSGIVANSGNAVAMGNTAVPYPDVSGGGSQNGSVTSIFSTAARSLGCSSSSSDPHSTDPDAAAAAELECMRALPAAAIKAYVQSTGSAPGTGAGADGLSFAMVADNLTVFSAAAYAAMLAGDDENAGVPTAGTAGRTRGASLPLLIGTTTEEGTAIVPYTGWPGAETAAELPAELQAVADGFRLSVQCATVREVGLRTSSSSSSYSSTTARRASDIGGVSSSSATTTYQYLYAGNFSDISPRAWLGAYHTAELPLIFGTSGPETAGTEGEGEADYERAASLAMQDRYVAFARDPVNGLRNAGWEAADGGASGGASTVMLWASDGGDGQGEEGMVEELITIKAMMDECVANGYEV